MLKNQIRFKYNSMRYLNDKEKADALASTFQGHFALNDHNDLDQEREFRTTLNKINEIDPGSRIGVPP